MYSQRIETLTLALRLLSTLFTVFKNHQKCLIAKSKIFKFSRQKLGLAKIKKYLFWHENSKRKDLDNFSDFQTL